jgi:hypothetical protein
MDGTQKKMKLSRKVITHPPFASFFVSENPPFFAVSTVLQVIISKQDI